MGWLKRTGIKSHGPCAIDVATTDNPGAKPIIYGGIGILLDNLNLKLSLKRPTVITFGSSNLRPIIGSVIVHGVVPFLISMLSYCSASHNNKRHGAFSHFRLMGEAPGCGIVYIRIIMIRMTNGHTKIVEFLKTYDRPKSEFAAAIGVGRDVLCHIERQRRTPTIKQAAAIERETNGAIQIEDWIPLEAATDAPD